MDNKWDLLMWSLEEWIEKERPLINNTYNSGKFTAFQKVLRTMQEFDSPVPEKFTVDVRELVN